MDSTVFFSWQSDIPAKVGRNFIEGALKDAIEELQSELRLEEVDRETVLKFDKDTLDAPGSPPILDTIFGKIDDAMAVVADLTFSGKRHNGRPTPNPNVLLEYGWALKSRSYNRIIGVMNKAFGDPKKEEMPFDLAHLRHPIPYSLSEGASSEEITKAKKDLTKTFVSALRNILAYDRKMQPKPAIIPFNPAPSADAMGRFRTSTQPIGVSTHLRLGQSQDVRLSSGPVYWLRLMPFEAQPKKWLTKDLELATTGPSGGRHFPPFGMTGPGSIGSLRSADGYGVFCADPDPNNVSELSFVFKSGEIWGIDALSPRLNPEYLLVRELEWSRVLNNYRQTLIDLGVTGTFKWVAGMEETLDRKLGTETGFARHWQGRSIIPQIVADGTLDRTESTTDALIPFFQEIYDAFGLTYSPPDAS